MADNKEKASANGDSKLAKLKALQTTIEKLDKTYGKGTVMKLVITVSLIYRLFRLARLVWILP